MDTGACSCGHPERPNINHRKTIPCWTYIGNVRHDVTADFEFVIDLDAGGFLPAGEQ